MILDQFFANQAVKFLFALQAVNFIVVGAKIKFAKPAFFGMLDLVHCKISVFF